MRATAVEEGHWWRVRRYMHTPERLAWVVASEREALGLSVGQLAQQAAVAPAAITALEAARPVSGPAEVVKVLTALGVKPLVLPVELAGNAE
jgi:ribosome-binding protein aMBF1 (putative translation factor)